MKKYKDVSSIRPSSSPDQEDERSSIPLLKRTIPRFRVSLPSRQSPPPKTTLAAIFMLIAGTIFLGAGSYIYITGLREASDRGLAMVLLGFLMFTPGSYATFVLYGAWKGWNGYDYNQIPSYDGDD